MAMTVGTGRLSSVASHVAQMMKQSGNGPLAVSKDVCALADEWANYKEEAGGQTCSQWLLGVSGQNEKFFRLRATAVDRIGEHARRTWDHLVSECEPLGASEPSGANAMPRERAQPRERMRSVKSERR